MSPRRVALAAFLAWLGPWVCGAPLQLELRLADGTVVRHFGVEDRGIQLPAANGSASIPLSAQWAMVGDLQETVAFIGQPAFSVRRRGLAGSAMGEFDAVAVLTAGADGLWPAKQLKAGIAVFVWLNEGKVTQVDPVPLRTSYLRNGDVVASARFKLGETERGGAAAVLLMRGEQWIVRPAKIEARERLRQAAARGDEEEVRRLLPTGGGRRRVAEIFPALEAAVQAARAEATGPLLEAIEADLRANEWGALIELALPNGHDEQAAWLIARSLERGLKPARRDELADLALARGLPKSVMTLVGATPGRFVAALDAARFGPVAAQGNPILFQFLLEHGLTLARVDPNSRSLGLAAGTGNVDLARRLIAGGAKPDPTDNNLAAPLYFAVRRGDRQMAELLLRAGASIERASGPGTTALHAAVLASDAGMAAWLIERGARPQPGIPGTSPLELALRLRRHAVVNALVAAGARLPRGGVTAELVEAAIAADSETLWLDAVESGWPVAQPLSGRWTARAVAEFYRAERCLARMGRDGASADEVAFGAFDTPPAPREVPLEPDLRRPDRDHVESTAVITGVVDLEGALRAVTISGIEEPELAARLRKASERFRFSPATRGGKPVLARVAWPLILPAQAKRLFSDAEIDLPAVELGPGDAPVPNYLPPMFVRSAAGPAWPVAMPGGALADIQTVVEGLGSQGVHLSLDPTRGTDGERLPRVRFVVSRDGVVTTPEVLSAASDTDRRDVLARLAGKRYLPAILGGKPVDVVTTAWVAPR